MTQTYTKKSICWFCKGRCGVSVEVRNGKLFGIELDKDYPEFAGSFGRGCRNLRLRYAVDWFYGKNRLNFPVKRAGKRGENRWTRISWQQAYDEIAGRLREMRDTDGPESLATSKGDDWTQSEYETRFMNLFGSPNVTGVSPICWGPRAIVSEAVFGWHPIYSVRPNTRCIIMLGVNPEVGRPVLVNAVRAAVKQGAKIITLDPQRTSIAEKSDLWLQLKPGTDAAVLLAMINHIIEKDLYDRDFVSRWCHGFQKLRERAASYTLAYAESVSGVPGGHIACAAEIYAENRPGIVFEGMGVEQQTNSAQIIQARCILAGLTGNVDVEGGEELDGPHPDFVSDRSIERLDMLSEKQKRRQIAYDRFRLHSLPGQNLLSETIAPFYGQRGGPHWYLGQTHLPSLYHAVISGDPYPIKGMIVSASNPMVSHPDTALVYKALKKLELLVVMDLCWTPTAQLADYVLPATSWLERPMLYSEGGFGKVLEALEPAVPAQTEFYDRRDDFDLWKELGTRLGQREYWPWKSVVDSYRERLREKDFTWEEAVEKRHIEDVVPKFRKFEKKGFATPTGKVELFSTIFERLGYDPLPAYVPHPYDPAADPGEHRDYPLTMINGARVKEYMLSTWRDVPAMRKHYPDPIVKIHPETARGRGIAEGDWVWIETQKGRIRQKCRYSDSIQKDVIHCDGQWWYPEMPGEEPSLHGAWISNVNVLLDADPDLCNPIIGSWPQRICSANISLYNRKEDFLSM